MSDNDETPSKYGLSPPLPDDDSSKSVVEPQQPEPGDVSANLDKPDGSETLSTEETKEVPKASTRRKIAPVKAEPEKSNDLQARKVSNPNQSPFLYFIIACIAGLFAIYVFNRHLAETFEPGPRLISYEAELKKMQAKYVNQTARFWTTFLASHELILTMNDPDVPAVIMLTIPERYNRMALCFAQHHAEVLNKVLGKTKPESSQPTYVDGRALSTLDVNMQKVRLEKRIQKIYDSNQRTIIINNLEKLHPESLSLFHGICDNLDAKYKDVAIIFILEVPEESNFTKDEDVYIHLYEVWRQLEPGAISALLARMANNVAIMQKVEHFVC